MTDFTKDLFAKGEVAESILILLEGHWPEMADRAEVRWVESLAWQENPEELSKEAREMENNQENAAGLGYDIYKKYKQQKADEIIENWSWWHPELEGGSRIIRHR